MPPHSTHPNASQLSANCFSISFDVPTLVVVLVDLAWSIEVETLDATLPAEFSLRMGSVAAVLFTREECALVPCKEFRCNPSQQG